MGRRLQLEWHESESELKQRYQSEKHGERRSRLQALWLLRQGKRVADVVEVLGVNYRTVQDWVGWYRQGGLAEVLRRVRGHQARGQPAYLTHCNSARWWRGWRWAISKRCGRYGNGWKGVGGLATPTPGCGNA